MRDVRYFCDWCKQQVTAEALLQPIGFKPTHSPKISADTCDACAERLALILFSGTLAKVPTTEKERV